MNDAKDGSPPASPAAAVKEVPLWQPMLFATMAGGMAWGIRGQYGHETGAMIAGLLVGLVLALSFRPQGDRAAVARAVAWCTVAMGFGGSMTYGQTVGLTHDKALVGHWDALGWGMLGLAIKGGIWIGFAGIFLGMGLGGVRYGTREMLLVMLGMLALCAAGIWTLNEPFDPAHRILPKLYFSDDWRWEPDAELKPRREVWGGLLFALLGLLTYTGWRRRDGLAWRLGGWGVLGGVLGFPLGQSLQASHAWNLDYFRSGTWAKIDPLVNWWNFMETTFGAVMGAMLGLGLWLNRRRIAAMQENHNATMPSVAEWSLLAIHLTLLVGVEFLSVRWIDALYDFGLILGFIPVLAVAGGRWWAYLVVLPVTAIPIAGKTLRHMAYQEQWISPWLGWLLCLGLPLGVVTAAAILFGRKANILRPVESFLRPALLLTAWLYFGLNYAFFHFPWPWATWTSRTPNSLVYIVCVLGLTLAALRMNRLIPKPAG